MADHREVAVRQAVTSAIGRAVPAGIRGAACGGYHRVRLRLGFDPRSAPGEYEEFLAAELHRLRLGCAEEMTCLEFGVYQGASLAAAVRASDRAGLGPHGTFVGFDAFDGLEPGVAARDWRVRWFFTSRSTAEWNLRRLKVLHRVELVEGPFDLTLTDELAERIGRVHVAMFDGGLVRPTAMALAFIEEMVADRCLLFFDDWSGDEAGSLGHAQQTVFEEFRARLRGRRFEPLGGVGRRGVGFLLTVDPLPSGI